MLRSIGLRLLLLIFARSHARVASAILCPTWDLFATPCVGFTDLPIAFTKRRLFYRVVPVSTTLPDFYEVLSVTTKLLTDTNLSFSHFLFLFSLWCITLRFAAMLRTFPSLTPEPWNLRKNIFGILAVTHKTGFRTYSRCTYRICLLCRGSEKVSHTTEKQETASNS